MGAVFEYKCKCSWLYMSPFRSVVCARQSVHHIMYMPIDRSYSSVRGNYIPDFIVRRRGAMFILSNAAPRTENGRWGSFYPFPASLSSLSSLFLGIAFLTPLTCPISFPGSRSKHPEARRMRDV